MMTIYRTIQILLAAITFLMMNSCGRGSDSACEANGVVVECPVYKIGHINPTMRRLLDEIIVPEAKSRGINDKTGVVLITNMLYSLDVRFYDRTDCIPVETSECRFAYMKYSDNLTIYVVYCTEMYCLFDLEETKSTRFTTELPDRIPVFYYASEEKLGCIYDEPFIIDGGSYRNACM